MSLNCIKLVTLQSFDKKEKFLLYIQFAKEFFLILTFWLRKLTHKSDSCVLSFGEQYKKSDSQKCSFIKVEQLCHDFDSNWTFNAFIQLNGFSIESFQHTNCVYKQMLTYFTPLTCSFIHYKSALHALNTVNSWPPPQTIKHTSRHPSPTTTHTQQAREGNNSLSG